MGVLGAGSNAGGGRLVLGAAIAAGVAVVALGVSVGLVNSGDHGGNPCAYHERPRVP